jgi:hypothetical protein
MKSDRPGPARLTKYEQPVTHERRDDDTNVSQPSWLEPWLEAEEEIYSLPCTD